MTFTEIQIFYKQLS